MKKIIKRNRLNEDDSAQQQQNNGNGTPAVDYNKMITENITFIGNLLISVQKMFNENFIKSCPTIDLIAKDQNSIVKDDIKKVIDLYTKFTKAQIQPEDTKVVTESLTAFQGFIKELVNFNTVALTKSEEAKKKEQEQAAQTAQQNSQSAAANASALQQAVNASRETKQFGNILSEKLNNYKIEQSLRNRY